MPRTFKHPRNRAATTQRIVGALEEALAKEGIEGLSVSQLAHQAGISKVLIYRYFGSLAGLLDYYSRLGRVVPHLTTVQVERLQPRTPSDLAPLWSGQALRLFRGVRASRASRQLLLATVRENNPLADAVSRAQDEELTRLVDQLAFIRGADYQATSAVVLGALSYLTVQAQQDRSILGIDLRSEAGWQRVEAAVSVIYNALGRLANDSPGTQVYTKPTAGEPLSW